MLKSGIMGKKAAFMTTAITSESDDEEEIAQLVDNWEDPLEHSCLAVHVCKKEKYQEKLDSLVEVIQMTQMDSTHQVDSFE